MAVFFKRSTYSGAEPITLPEAKAFLRVDSDDDNSYITELITMTRDFIEKETNTALVSHTYTEYRDGFPTTNSGVITLQINGDLTVDNSTPQVAYLKDGNWTNLTSGDDEELIVNGEFDELGANLISNPAKNSQFTDETTTWLGAGNHTLTLENENLKVVTTGAGGSSTNSIHLGHIYIDTLYDEKVYVFTFDAKAISGAPTLRARQPYCIIPTTTDFTLSTTNKTFNIFGTREDSQNAFFSLLTAGTFFIDNVLVKQVDPNEYWTLGTGWTIGDDQAVQTGETSLLSYESFTPTIGIKYTVIYKITEYTSGSTSLDFAGSSLEHTESSEGTYTYEITATTTDIFQIKSNAFIGAIGGVSIKVTGDYFTAEFNGLPRIDPNGGWDVTPDARLNSVKIIYTAGPPEAGVIAPPLKQAMYLLLAHYYDNRSAVTFGNPKELPLGYKRIINNYKNPIWS